MATFARPTFSAKAYAAFRPTYPQSLFRTVLNFHQQHPQQTPDGAGTLLDLGCGHGLIARGLSPQFKSVVAIDPSAGMVAQAQRTTDDTKITFREGSAEDLSFLADRSVDMAVAGQAAHWFDYGKVWPNLARVVRPGGTLAFWGYKDNVLLGATQATEIMEQFVYGFGEVAPGVEGMGPYWEQPGRSILRDLLRSVQAPEKDWTDVTRLEHEPGQEGSGEEACWLRKKMKLGEVEGYTRTFSCFSGWRDAHPEAKSRADGGDGDVVDFMWDRMVDAVPEWKALGERWREAEVVSDWGTYVLMARRR
ncbi:Uu.00g021190.m01.CDS01 [Anthostomella pinea]|uniref:Uu.00g021190.m01.CDS01 n=1 Tax=Anthostomella pinea TaxID=933095 RepID=A0AAI8YQW4_9PEZI|nr:Uu.00g021190.m01.CDS01 [Anthostomella pinea]